MPIDLGDVPVGTPPTNAQKLQIRNSIGAGVATGLVAPASPLDGGQWYDDETGSVGTWYAAEGVWVDGGGSPGATTFAGLTDNTSANLPSINIPLANALALKAPLISPSFTTPALGTPSSGNLTNCTFPTLNQSTTGNAATVTTNANLTGHITSVGNTTSLGSFALAQLSTAVSDADIARTDSGQTFAGNQVFSGNLSVTGTTTTSKIVVPADSLTALGVFRADGTTRVLNIDTTNSRLGIGTSAPSYPIHVERNANDTTTAVIMVKNLSSGNTATAEIRTENNASQSGRMFKTSASYSGYKTILASDLGFYNDSGAGHITILNDFAGGTIKFAAGGSSTPHLTIGSAGDIQLPKTITVPGTTGARTINQTSGRVNFAAAATSLTVTNSLCSSTSMIYCTIATNDATANGIRVVAGAGSFTIFLLTAPTTETTVNFLLTN